MKRRKPGPLGKPRNPVARSPLLGKGGAHDKPFAAKRRRANVALQRRLRQSVDDA